MTQKGFQNLLLVALTMVSKVSLFFMYFLVKLLLHTCEITNLFPGFGAYPISFVFCLCMYFLNYEGIL